MKRIECDKCGISRGVQEEVQVGSKKFDLCAPCKSRVEHFAGDKDPVAA